MERRLEQSASASAAAAASAASKKARGKRQAAAAAAAGEALRELTRVAPAQLAAAASDLSEHGALPPEVAGRVQSLARRLKAPPGDGAPQLSYRWPPPPAAAGGGARAGRGGAQQVQQAQRAQQAVKFETAKPGALGSFLEGTCLSPDSAGMPELVRLVRRAPCLAGAEARLQFWQAGLVPTVRRRPSPPAACLPCPSAAAPLSLPQKDALCCHLPSLQPLLDAMPSPKPRTQQVRGPAALRRQPRLQARLRLCFAHA